MNTNGSLEGQTALVTGGGSGIGRSTALGLAARGATVYIMGRNREKLSEVAGHYPERIQVAAMDIRDERACQRLLEDLPAPLDVFIGNAALSLFNGILDGEEGNWEEVLSVNFRASIRICVQAARLMKATGRGRIVNVTSVHGHLCERESSAYGVAKAGLNQFTRSLACELAPHGILANAVAPGFVDTPMSSASGVNELETEAFRRNYIENGRIPLGRAADPDEIAEAILFLASPANTYITGQVLVVDGGLSITL